MKAQNCPLCGSKSTIWIDRQDEEEPLAFCLDEFKKECDFRQGDFCIDLETWNRLRMAPDGENVEKFSLMTDHRDGGQEIGSYISDAYILPSDDGDLAEYKDWMNPRYPDDE